MTSSVKASMSRLLLSAMSQQLKSRSFVLDFNPSQSRAPDGKWTGDGGGFGSDSKTKRNTRPRMSSDERSKFLQPYKDKVSDAELERGLAAKQRLKAQFAADKAKRERKKASTATEYEALAKAHSETIRKAEEASREVAKHDIKLAHARDRLRAARQTAGSANGQEYAPERDIKHAATARAAGDAKSRNAALASKKAAYQAAVLAHKTSPSAEAARRAHNALKALRDQRKRLGKSAAA